MCTNVCFFEKDLISFTLCGHRHTYQSARARKKPAGPVHCPECQQAHTDFRLIEAKQGKLEVLQQCYFLNMCGSSLIFKKKV